MLDMPSVSSGLVRVSPIRSAKTQNCENFLLKRLDVSSQNFALAKISPYTVSQFYCIATVWSIFSAKIARYDIDITKAMPHTQHEWSIPFGRRFISFTLGGQLWLSLRASDGYCTFMVLSAWQGHCVHPQWSCVHDSGLERRNLASHFLRG